MHISKKILAAGVILSLLGGGMISAADTTTANVAVDSVYYQYLDKLSGMGYVKSLPNGAKPYSRMQMARWVLEAEETAKDRPMPAYLADQFDALKTYVAPEVETLQGNPTKDEIRLREASIEAAYHHGDAFSYAYGNVAGSWAPFGSNRNGHKYGRNGNIAGTVEISGNVAPELAVSVKARAAWDKDNDGTASLEEGYVKTRLGSVAFEAGRQALTWGQGESGHLLLGNNTKPLTTIQAHLTNPVKVGGFFHFLGEVDAHAFYGFAGKDRKADALKIGKEKDFDDAGFIGLRLDVTPSSHFTFGASRVSLLGGKGNGLSHSDWLKHWPFGTNADSDDKWDDIGGFDFRFRYSDFQIYGEWMGEDQAGGLPYKWAYRAGVYLPKLTADGSWDLTLEAAKTTDVWYTHSTYQGGWTYSGDILGDDMGNDARKYYAKVNHYLPGEKTLGFYFLRTERQRNWSTHPTVDEMGLMGQMKLSGNRYLNGTLGYARVKAEETDNHLFAAASLEWKW